MYSSLIILNQPNIMNTLQNNATANTSEVETIFERECGYDTRKTLNRCDVVIPAELIDNVRFMEFFQRSKKNLHRERMYGQMVMKLLVYRGKLLILQRRT